MQKLTKTQVKALAKVKGAVTVELYPSKCGPANQVWVKGYELTIYHNPKAEEEERFFTKSSSIDMPFDERIQDFAYYNCIPELGKRVHYYLKEDDTLGNSQER